MATNGSNGHQHPDNRIDSTGTRLPETGRALVADSLTSRHDGPVIRDRSRGDWSTRLINGASGWDDWPGCSYRHRRNGEGVGIVVRPRMTGLSAERRAMLERALERAERRLGYSQGAETNGYRVDCSGLVSCAWGLPCPGLTTRRLVDPTVSRLIEKAVLLPGDAIITQGHAVLFAGWSDSGRTDYVAIEDCGAMGTVARAVVYPYFRQPELFHPYRLVAVSV